jgi:hypothetical protein
MIRAVWPSLASSRANQFAIAQASMPTRHAARCAPEHRLPVQRALHDHASRRILPAQRHDALCQIQSHGSNLIHDFPSPVLNVEIQSWHFAAVASRGSPFYSVNRTRRFMLSTRRASRRRAGYLQR